MGADVGGKRAMPKAVHPIDRMVGLNIRIFRLAKDMSQTELGRAIGVSFQQVQKYENGYNRVGSSRLAKIAETLGVPVNRLFDNETRTADGHVNGALVTDLLAVPYAVQMLRAFGGMANNDVRRSFVDLMECLRDAGGDPGRGAKRGTRLKTGDH
jgi:transcriptional regulator with XRE-family HTH domain